MKTLFLDSVAGVAGDMFAASFVDAGLVSMEDLQGLPARLGLNGVRVEISHPVKATMKTTHLDVSWDHEGWKTAFGSHSHSSVMNPSASHSAHWHTHYRQIDSFLEKSRLEAATKAFARKVFRLIAEAEADAHGMSVEDVSFHEVGAVDSIVDVVMAAHCVATVGAARVLATPVRLGRGFVKIEHGTHAIPPPASSRLAVGMPIAEIPAAITRPNVELSTPTGLAILKALEPSWLNEMPPGVLRAQGMGAGTMDLGDYPNVFRVALLEADSKEAGLPFENDRVVELCCNVDDESPERVAWVVEKLLALGALDAWSMPAHGKKGRIALVLSVLCEEKQWQDLADWLLRHTSTFGLRHRVWDRLKLARKFERRETAQGPVTFKIGMTLRGETLKEKPEFEDLKKIWDRDPDFRP